MSIIAIIFYFHSKQTEEYIGFKIMFFLFQLERSSKIFRVNNFFDKKLVLFCTLKKSFFNLFSTVSLNV